MFTSIRTLTFAVAVGSFVALGGAGAYAQAANPCAAQKPMDDKAMMDKKPMGDKAMMDKKPANPCAAKPANPCAPKAANPCAAKKM